MDKNSNNDKDKDKKKGFFHFRFNRRRKHNSLIVKENDKDYEFFTLTHSKQRDDRHKNIKLFKNPNPKDKRNSYIENKLSKDKKGVFGRINNNLKLSSKDKQKVKKLYQKKLKSKKNK